MKKAAAVVGGLALALAGLAAPSPASGVPSTTPPPVPALSGYTPPPLGWGACDDLTLQSFGAECADLDVPLDYARPNGRTITLAVSRLKHTSPDADYQGVMLANPGGPGESGLTLSIFGQGSFIPGDGDLTYDWIGFDPRGVGRSTPALSCDSSFFGYDRPNYNPRTRALEKVWLQRSKDYAKACQRSDAAALLPHMKTTDNVSDMESLRKALGESQINYYGFSYGTYLGQVYATLHPDRVRRLVLVGNEDPTRVWYKANFDKDIAFQKSINVYFGWLAKHDSVFHLGTTRKAVASGFYRERRALDKKPAGDVIGPDELTDVMQSAAYSVLDWVGISQDYAALVNDGDHAGIQARFDDANPQTRGSDNSYAVYLATVCTDAPWPDSWNKIRRDNWRVNAKAPFATWASAWGKEPCSFWPAKSARPVKVTGRQVQSNILMINETLDAATPYSGALEVRRRFPTASLVEGVGGTTHSGSPNGVACTDNAIGQYLTDGTAPARRKGDRSDLQCPPTPQPDPSQAGAVRTSANAQVRKELGKELARARAR